LFIFQNYTKQFSLTTYGGISWKLLTGIEMVVTNSIPTYYTLDYAISRVTTFDQYWNYQTYNNLPFPYSYDLKCVNGYFYITSNSYFYKTDLSFTVVCKYLHTNAMYRQMYYDSTSSLFYTAPVYLQVIQVFDTNCALVQNISLGIDYPYGLNYFQGKMYVGTQYNSVYGSNQIVVLENGIIKNRFNVTLCSIVSIWGLLSINIDAFGYMANTCYSNNTIILTDYNGNNLNNYITTSIYPYISRIDASGRFVIMTGLSLDIYY
jgi:hypothetical protein